MNIEIMRRSNNLMIRDVKELDEEAIREAIQVIEKINDIINHIWDKVKKCIKGIFSYLEERNKKNIKYKKRVNNRKKLYRKRVAKYGRY